MPNWQNVLISKMEMFERANLVSRPAQRAWLEGYVTALFTTNTITMGEKVIFLMQLSAIEDDHEIQQTV